jgi:hypothetical protein
MSRAAAPLLLVSATAACGGPQLAWYGHTPDRAQRVEVRQQGGEQWLTLGARASRRYRYVAAEELAFDGDAGHLAFAAEVGESPERWTVVEDFVEGRAWDGVSGLRFGPHGRRFVYAALEAGLWRMVVDGAPARPHESVDVASVAFSPDGRRVGYAVQDGECARVVVDGREGDCIARVVALAPSDEPAGDVIVTADAVDGSDAHVLVGGRRVFDAPVVRELAVDPQVRHWAVVTGAAAAWRVVADGVRQPPFEQIRGVAWSAQDGHVAYAARIGGSWRIVLDAHAGPPHVEVESPVFAARGARFGYVARDAGGSVVTIDDRVAWESAAPATALTFSEDGARVAWMYRDEGGAVIAVDGERHRFEVAVDRTLSFSRDGRHWGALVGSIARRRLYVTVDGAAALPFDAEELFGSAVAGSDTGERLAAWVSAEMERYLAHATERGS